MQLQQNFLPDEYVNNFITVFNVHDALQHPEIEGGHPERWR